MEERKNMDLVPSDSERSSAAAAKYIALKVIISLLGIAIAVLFIVFVFEMIGGAVGSGTSEVVSSLEEALNGDFESYWALLPEDYVRTEAVKAGAFTVDYKNSMKSSYKEYAAALAKTKRSYSLEASKERKLTADELSELNGRLISEYGITKKCTDAVSITLTVGVTVDSQTHSTDRNDFLIGKIDGEWYPLDFEFVSMTE